MAGHDLRDDPCASGLDLGLVGTCKRSRNPVLLNVGQVGSLRPPLEVPHDGLAQVLCGGLASVPCHLKT